MTDEREDEARGARVPQQSSGAAALTACAAERGEPEFVFTFHEDPGHGWLAVPRTLIDRLNIAEAISPCSHQDGHGMVYLEEDRDETIFLEAADRARLSYDFDERVHGDFCFIRDLPRYAPEGRGLEAEGIREPDEPERSADVAALREAALGMNDAVDAAGRSHLSLDARFADVPLTEAEIKGLDQARTPWEAYALIGEYHEARDRTEAHGAGAERSERLLDHALSREEQIAVGLKPAGADRAYIEDGAAKESEIERTKEVMLRYQGHNARYYLDARAMARAQEALRNQHAQSFFNDPDFPTPAAMVREAAFHGGTPEINALRRRVELDGRFDREPLTAAEIEGLRHAATSEQSAGMLGAYQETRQPGPTLAREKMILLDRALSEKEQIDLALKPTPGEHRYLEGGDADGTELGRTLEFLDHRLAQNARYQLDAEGAAREQQTLAGQQDRAYWYEKRERSLFTERDTRTEKSERRTDVGVRRAEIEARREGGPRQTINRDRDGREREDGGRER